MTDKEYFERYFATLNLIAVLRYSGVLSKDVNFLRFNIAHDLAQKDKV